MLKITDLISETRVQCDVDVSSKKRSLELLSELLAAEDQTLSPTAVFNKLVGREKLGSTGLGHGVALPHARMEGVGKATAAFIKLPQGVDYDAFDHEPVDLLFALVVPEHFTDEHLQILGLLAEMFSNTTLCRHLRESHDEASLRQLLADWEAKHATA